MLYGEIMKVREELDNAIKNGEDYHKIYTISVKLDKLIAKYYQMKLNTSKS